MNKELTNFRAPKQIASVTWTNHFSVFPKRLEIDNKVQITEYP